jgi:hypothetical protein
VRQQRQNGLSKGAYVLRLVAVWTSVAFLVGVVGAVIYARPVGALIFVAGVAFGAVGLVSARPCALALSSRLSGFLKEDARA